MARKKIASIAAEPKAVEWSVRFRRPDGTYLIEAPGLPCLYHVDPGDNPELYAAVHAAADGLGEALPFEPQPEPEPVTLDTFRRAIQVLVDETARQRHYDSGITCASYIGSTSPAWAAEAQAFVAWRDAVWTYALAELPKVEAGQRPQPSVEAFVGELPPMAWPE